MYLKILTLLLVKADFYKNIRSLLLFTFKEVPGVKLPAEENLMSATASDSPRPSSKVMSSATSGGNSAIRSFPPIGTFHGDKMKMFGNGNSS